MLLCTSSLTRQCDVFNASTPGHPPHPKSHTLTELVFLSTPPPPLSSVPRNPRRQDPARWKDGERVERGAQQGGVGRAQACRLNVRGSVSSPGFWSSAARRMHVELNRASTARYGTCHGGSHIGPSPIPPGPLPPTQTWPVSLTRTRSRSETNYAAWNQRPSRIAQSEGWHRS